MNKEIMEQYEAIRQSGVTNMYDYYTVMRVARIINMPELGKLSLDEYKDLLMNFTKYMKKYNIIQPPRKKW